MVIDNALAESVIGLFKTEGIRAARPLEVHRSDRMGNLQMGSLVQ